MKKLLLTGADGFTGKHFKIAAEAAGYDVVPLMSDLIDREAVFCELMQVKPNYVVHLGAISAVTHSDDGAFYQVNLFGTLNLVAALDKLPRAPRMVLLASSANVYGNSDIDQISELTSPKPVNHYAMSKLAMEYMVSAYTKNIQFVFTRPFNYTGAGQDNRFVVPKIIEQIKLRSPVIELGNLDVFREYNDVRFVCNAYLQLLESGISGETYNICTGHVYSLREVVGLAEKIAGFHIEMKVNPRFVRKNEVISLAGNPDKLNSTIGVLNTHSLEETLTWMLK